WPKQDFATFSGVSGQLRMRAATAGEPLKRRYSSGNTGLGILCAQRCKFWKMLNLEKSKGLTDGFVIDSKLGLRFINWTFLHLGILFVQLIYFFIFSGLNVLIGCKFAEKRLVKYLQQLDKILI
ncbi:hypothetical protein D7X33_36915, partial [Butyricicoccus sp. 1XD8-22]